jgi:hypothetical protein
MEGFALIYANHIQTTVTSLLLPAGHLLIDGHTKAFTLCGKSADLPQMAQAYKPPRIASLLLPSNSQPKTLWHAYLMSRHSQSVNQIMGTSKISGMEAGIAVAIDS